jgi:hypothetical protein
MLRFSKKNLNVEGVLPGEILALRIRQHQSAKPLRISHEFARPINRTSSQIFRSHSGGYAKGYSIRIFNFFSQTTTASLAVYHAIMRRKAVQISKSTSV